MRSSKQFNFARTGRQTFNDAVHFVRFVTCGTDFGHYDVAIQPAVQHPRIALHSHLFHNAQRNWVFSRYQNKFFVKCEMYQTVFFAVVKPVTRPSGSDDPLQLVGLDPNDFVYSFVAPQLKTLERPRFTNWIHSMIYIDRLNRIKCTSLPSSIARPVTQRKMSPSSWRIGILSCLISSSDKVP